MQKDFHSELSLWVSPFTGCIYLKPKSLVLGDITDKAQQPIFLFSHVCSLLPLAQRLAYSFQSEVNFPYTFFINKKNNNMAYHKLLQRKDLCAAYWKSVMCC